MQTVHNYLQSDETVMAAQSVRALSYYEDMVKKQTKSLRQFWEMMFVELEGE